jgi:peptide/nickel transport system substrate-binding protein
MSPFPDPARTPRLIPRRRFLAIGIVSVTGLTLSAACAPTAPASAPTSAPAKPADAKPAEAKPTEAARPAEAAKPAEAKPAAEAKPTAAPAAPAKPAGGEKTLTIQFTTSNPQTIDPHIANESQSNIVALSLYESLVAYKYGTSEIEPRLATEWKISDDGKTYTFKLRPNVKFTDGTPFDAEAVKLSFDRLAGMGKGPAFVLAGIFDRVDVVDPMTVNVVLKTAVGHFLTMLPKAFIVNPKFVQANTGADDKWAEKAFAEKANGTGPFDLEKWEQNQQLVFVKKKEYWGLPERPKVDRVVFRIIPEQATAQLMLERGELDLWGSGISVDALPRLKTNQQIVISEDPTLVALYIQVSQVKPPLDNPKVRQAIALAFDYQGFIEGVYQGHATQAQGVVAKGAPFHDTSLPQPTKDIAKAKQLLAESGVNVSGLELEYIAVSGDPPEKGAGLILQEGLKELGIGLKVAELQWPAMVARMQTEDRAQNMHLYGYYRFPPYADPDAYFFGPFHTSQQIKGFNGTFYGTPETDGLMEKARTSTDPKEREQIYKTLQKRLVDDVAVLALANPTSITAYRSTLKNYKYTPPWHQTVYLDQLDKG